MISQEHSVFPILTFDEQHPLETLLALAQPELDPRGWSRLRKMLGTSCRCVVLERHYIDKDYRNTFSHFHSKRFATPTSRCLRLHFFSEPVKEAEIASMTTELRAKVQAAYLGYCILRPTKPNCIGRTLVSHRVRSNQESHLCVCREKVMLLGAELTVEGFPFISQDADVTVCAESMASCSRRSST